MRTRIFIGLAIGAVLFGQGCMQPAKRSSTPTPQPIVQPRSMKVSSTAFAENQPIPVIYSCDGTSTSPPLTFEDVPMGAKSLAVIVDDPDTASDFVHWVVFNIDSSARDIPAGKLPANSVEGSSGKGTPGYVGLCPPSGIHHYQFTVYALDAMLELTASAKKSDVMAAMQGHVLSDAMLVGTYTRH